MKGNVTGDSDRDGIMTEIETDWSGDLLGMRQKPPTPAYEAVTQSIPPPRCNDEFSQIFAHLDGGMD